MPWHTYNSVDEKHAEITKICNYIRILSFSFMHPKISFMLCAIATKLQARYKISHSNFFFFTKGHNSGEPFLTLKALLFKLFSSVFLNFFL